MKTESVSVRHLRPCTTEPCISCLKVLSEKTGEVLAVKKLPFSVEATSSPLVTRGEIIFGTAGEGIVALDRKTLDIKWKYRTGKAMIYTSPYTNGEMAQVESTPVLSGDMVIVGASDGTFYAVNRKNGSLMWRHKTGSPILTTVAVSGKTFFGTDFSGNIYCFKAE
ncbi:outer membrane protein assembly factor BamB family protein [Phocaeicola coprophilus]|uniref:outer membrane protein assembly factor BamB family protein n=1 Tax=Phocaeicola coprophilus TaxID=387090 RepID=UPI00266C7345|nr:PQQ-binding-like beta-propeller repeat protein [Phocaeicola coprophilus]